MVGRYSGITLPEISESLKSTLEHSVTTIFS
jgi:hypothetical protein